MAQLLFACSHMHSYDECMSGEERDEDRSMSDTHLKSYTYNGSTLERSNVTSIMTYAHKGQMSLSMWVCMCRMGEGDGGVNDMQGGEIQL